MTQRISQDGPLWAITSYYNPVGYRRRRENFRVFRDQLTIPLMAVELSFDGHFELQPGDAEILLRIHGRDVMWQKERLLNVAAAALPTACTKVAILDCDVVFMRPDWAEALSRRLDDVPLLQPFSTVHYLPPDLPITSPNALTGDFTRPSVAFLIEQGISAQECLGSFAGRRPGTRAPGHAVAVRRDFLDAHGLYDACIIGGGDVALLGAYCGSHDEIIGRHVMNDAQVSYYLDWGNRVERASNGNLGCVSGDLIHLWHGEMSDRRTPQRYNDFAPFAFNPYEDIALEPSGCWRWNSDKPAMHDYARTYFAIRKEDGPASVEFPDEPRLTRTHAPHETSSRSRKGAA